MTEVQATREALVAARDRLVRDHRDVPVGAVIRCFAHALVRARQDGTPRSSLVEASELLARSALVRRGAAGHPVAAGRGSVATVAGTMAGTGASRP